MNLSSANVSICECLVVAEQPRAILASNVRVQSATSDLKQVRSRLLAEKHLVNRTVEDRITKVGRLITILK